MSRPLTAALVVGIPAYRSPSSTLTPSWTGAASGEVNDTTERADPTLAGAPRELTVAHARNS
jgi:hypothetical protein